MMSFEKASQRRINYEVVRGIKPFWKGDRFLWSWLELAGDTGDRSHALMKPHLSSPKQFILCEKDPEVFLRNRLKLFRMPAEERFEAPFGDVYQNANHALDVHSPAPAVFCFDTTEILGLARYWEGHGGEMRVCIQKTLEKVGCGLLILNGTIDRGDLSPSELLRAQAVHMARHFGQWIDSPRRFLDGLEDASVDDRDFLGPAGGYDVYRSDDRVLRMATVRIRFDRGMKATVYRPKKVRGA
jgi:hypothetical protein